MSNKIKVKVSDAERRAFNKGVLEGVELLSKCVEEVVRQIKEKLNG